MIEHSGEPQSNELRRRTVAVEPAALRTYTPSLAAIAKSAGCYHWTPEGRKLADFTSGVLVANLGHHPARWWRRVVDYMGLVGLGIEGKSAKLDGCVAPTLRDRDTHAAGSTDGGFIEGLPLTAYNAVTELEVCACERLLANLRGQPGGGRMQQVLWAASGSEAIQKALWAALAWHAAKHGTTAGHGAGAGYGAGGNQIILATRAGFHGKKGLAGAITGCETDPDRDPRVRFIGFPTVECQNVGRRRQPIALAPYESELETAWSEYGSRIACLCTEPYLGGGGSFHPQPEYLQLLERFCRRHDIPLILDEIQSNFGRTGPMYAFTHYGVEPDIVCLGKGLGNGVPVSAAVGRADLFAPLAYGQASDTFSGHPLGCAAVLATLDEFESTDVLSHAARLSKVIETGLLRLTELPTIAHVRGEGTVWGVECAAVGKRSAAEVAQACVAACYRGDRRGRAIHLLGPLAGKVIRVSPPLVMPIEEAAEYLEAMVELMNVEC